VKDYSSERKLFRVCQSARAWSANPPEPLVQDKLFFRVAGKYFLSDGYFDNTFSFFHRSGKPCFFKFFFGYQAIKFIKEPFSKLQSAPGRFDYKDERMIEPKLISLRVFGN